RELEIEADAQIRARPEQQQTVNADEEFDPLQLDRYSRLQAKSRDVTEMLDQLAKVERDLGNRASNFGGVLQQQSHLGDQLQSGLMSARMVLVGESLPRLRYLVRETSKQADKKIEFEFHGGDIAVDRQVIETMMAPFEHMIRNAVIHGIESVEERTRNGKSKVGRIAVSLVQQGSELVVEFSDDGRGLDVEKLSARAVELGLVHDQNNVSEVELLQVITQPGYSTSDSLSMESGRGVGMDVVYQAVRDLGGSMSLLNRPGNGVTFQFRLPVSLAVTQALLVGVANWKFAIQSRTIERLMRVPANEIFEQNNQRMVAVDDLKLPLLSIRDRLGEPPFPGKRNYVSVVLVRLADRLAAFEVDQFEDSVNIVSKVPGKQLDSIPEIAGVTVLGDSGIVLILDPESFVDRIAPLQDTAEDEARSLGRAASLRRVLVVDDSLVVRKVMQKDLEADGLEVETAVDGLNALEVLDRSNFDIALVDIEMPRMNGYELLEKLRQHSRCSDLPVIIITSRSGSQHKKRAVELGADGYITKPYDISALDQLMRQVVDNKRKLH
ncbi:MAG: hybrid sensor histidine kinase/response regulator, partial [bacterium]